MTYTDSELERLLADAYDGKVSSGQVAEFLENEYTMRVSLEEEVRKLKDKVEAWERKCSFLLDEIKRLEGK